jgi:hypothetical protein
MIQKSPAVKSAHRRRERIAGLVLYEPTSFGLLLADRDAALEIAVLRRVLGRYLEAGDWFRAALRYVDHCLAAGTGRASEPRSARRSLGACRSYARSSTPNSRIRHRSPVTPGSTYRYGS